MRPHLKEGHTSIRRKRWCMFLQEWDQEAQSPPNSRCWFWFHTSWSPLPPVSHAPPSLCLGAATGHHVSVGAAVGDGADVRKQGPTHTAGVSVSPRSKHHYANDFPAHPTPVQSYIFIIHSEVHVHTRPAKYLHPIYFNMPRCNLETRFSFPKGNVDYKVMN